MDRTSDIRWKTVLTIGVAGAGLVGIPGAIGYVVDKIQIWATQSFVLPKVGGFNLSAGQYVLSWWILFVLFLSFFAILVLMVSLFLSMRAMSPSYPDLGYIMPRGRRSPREDFIEESHEERRAKGVNFEEYTKITKSVRRIIYSEGAKSVPEVDIGRRKSVEMGSIEPSPRFKFNKIRCIFIIDEHGNTQVEQLYEIETLDMEANYWHIRMVKDSYSEKFETLNDINFELKSMSPELSIESIPMDFTENEGGAALFFVPKILPKKEAKFKVQYYWRKWFGELAVTGMTHWTWSYMSGFNSEVDVQFTFVFDRRLGDVVCHNIEGHKTGASANIEKKENTIIYTDRRCLGSELTWILRFKAQA